MNKVGSRTPLWTSSSEMENQNYDKTRAYVVEF
jgi:hypothetical protein